MDQSKLRIVFIIFILSKTLSLYAQPFINIAESAGVDTVLGNVYPGFGISTVDFTGDGYDDLTLGTDNGDSILFYKNNGNDTFTKLPSKVDHTGISRQVLWVDIDNDDDLDFFVSSASDNGANGQNKLYENINDLLVDITLSSGLLIQNDNSRGASFGDIDNDGDLDLFVSNYQNHYSTLYKNNGNKTFTNITNSNGLNTALTPDLCAAFFDYNNDNKLDLISVVDKSVFPNILYKNNGNGMFHNVSDSTNITLPDDGMNAGINDFNNDGNFDIYVTNIKPPNSNIQGNALYYNAFAIFGEYIYVNNYSQIAGVEVNQDCWGAAFIDVNNDKFQDLYVTSENWNQGDKNNLFKNDGDETFSSYYQGGLQGDTLISTSVAVLDFNEDGKEDMVVSSINNEKLLLWKNIDTTVNNYVKIKLKGTSSNKKGIGSRIEIYDEDSPQYRFTHCGINYLGQNSLKEHIGMAEKTTIDSIIIKWPSGSVNKFYNLGVNQLYNITENTCLDHTYSSIGNTAANKYIGQSNGNLLLSTNWSKGHTPDLKEDVEINNTTPILLTLTNNANQTINCRSLKLSGNTTLNNNGIISINKSNGLGLLIESEATFNNNHTLNILMPCGKAVELKGIMNSQGITNIQKN